MSWPPPDRVVASGVRRRFRLGLGLTLRSLAPWSRAFVTQFPPWASSDSGVWLFRPGRRSPTRYEPRLHRRWSELAEIRAVGSEVRSGPELLLDMPPRAAASLLAVQLETLRRAAPAERARAAETVLRASLDRDALEARLKSAGVLSLRIASTAFALYVLLLAVGLVALDAALVLWRWWLGGFVLLLGSVLVETFVAHRRLYPEARGERWGRVVMLLLSFPLAGKAADLVTRDLLAGFHPLAAAHRLCAPRDFERVARAELLALDYPGRGEWEPEADGARLRLRRILAEALASWGVDVSALTALPAPEPGSRALCPRCGASYSQALESCGDCGVALARVSS